MTTTVVQFTFAFFSPCSLLMCHYVYHFFTDCWTTVVQLYSCKVAQLYSCAVVQLYNLPSLCSPSVELYIWPDVQLYSCKVVLGCSADFKTVFLISSINYLYFLWYMQILVGQTHWYCFSHRLGWSKEIRYILLTNGTNILSTNWRIFCTYFHIDQVLINNSQMFFRFERRYSVTIL